MVKRVRETTPPVTAKKSNGHEQSGAFTPPQVYVCKRCGHKGNKVEWTELLGVRNSQPQSFQLDIHANCEKCLGSLDKVNINVAFMGIGNWQVLKSYMG